MDTLFAEKFFYSRFENCKYYGWQPYSEYLQSMLETDIVLNPFPFGHTNTLIDTLIMGKPCVGLEGGARILNRKNDFRRGWFA